RASQCQLQPRPREASAALPAEPLAADRSTSSMLVCAVISATSPQTAPPPSDTGQAPTSTIYHTPSLPMLPATILSDATLVSTVTVPSAPDTYEAMNRRICP